MKPGIKTTEFWTAAITTGLAVVAQVFHTHLALNVPKDAALAAGAVNAAYAISRAISKHGFVGAIENEVGYEHVTTQKTVGATLVTTNKTVATPANADVATVVDGQTKVNPEQFGS